MDKIALLALKKSGAVDVSLAVAAKEAAEAAQEAAETAQGKAEDAQEAAEAAVASLTVDSAMSDSSTNPVQNKVIYGELSDLKSQITHEAVNENVLFTKQGTYTTFLQGTRNYYDNFTIETNSARCLSFGLFDLHTGDTIKISDIKSGQKTSIRGINKSTGATLYDSSFKTADFEYKVASDKQGYYCVIEAMSDGTSAITPTDVETVVTVTDNTTRITKNEDDITELKTSIDEFSDVVVGYNLIDPTKIVDGEYWAGSYTASGDYSRTPLIKVKPNTAYTFANTDFNYWSSTNIQARTIAFYAENGTYISMTEKTGNFTTPQNCAYVGLSFYKNARNVILIEGTYSITTQTMVYIPYVPSVSKVNPDAIADLSVDNINDYAVPGRNLFDCSKVVSGYLKQYPAVEASGNSFVSEYIPVKANVSYIVWHYYITGSNASLRSYVLYDEKHQKVSGADGNETNYVITPDVDGYLRFTGYNDQLYHTQVEVGTEPSTFEPYKEVFPEKALLNDEQLAQVNNVLFGKKWAVCGDSFTESGGVETTIQDGKYKGRPFTYPWIIGNRNNMDIAKFFGGGRTLAFPAEPDDFDNSLTCPSASYYYQNIPADVDYITIYLGINDEHHAPSSNGGDGEDNTGEIPLGTIDDATTATYYGAWNVVLTWLITNRPNAHIGIIVCNGLSIVDYRNAQIAIAQKYGIPYIDLNGDARTPAMLRTVNPDIPSAIKQALIAKWAIDPTGESGTVNLHPNADAQLFESTFIENFLKSI